MEGWISGTVVENKHWNQRLCSLRVKAELPMFEAGQFLRLALEVNGKLMARPYSLVNAPGDDIAEFYFNKVPDGPLSSRLHILQPGDKIWLSAMATGFLTLADIPPGKNLWMIATGTALGPFLSILKVGKVWQAFDKVVLVHGVRSLSELTYREYIDEVKNTYPDRFVFLASVTREKIKGTLSQRIPAAIESGDLEHSAGIFMTPENDRIMLCGNPGMIAASMDALGSKGLSRHRRRDPGQIILEIYK